MSETVEKKSVRLAELGSLVQSWARECDPVKPEAVTVKGRATIGKNLAATLTPISEQEAHQALACDSIEKIDTTKRDFNAAYTCRSIFREHIGEGQSVLFLLRDNKAALLEPTEETIALIEERNKILERKGWCRGTRGSTPRIPSHREPAEQ